jgi:serine/threonine-protein kinase HipA
MTGTRGHLAVWMNGELVGTWIHTRGRHLFSYAESWFRSERARPLSLSLPLTGQQLTGDKVENYFDNLLPDNDDIRRRIRQRFRTSSTEAFELLSEIGRDCVGAVQLLPTDERPRDIGRIESVPLDDAQVETILRDLTVTPRFGLGHVHDDGFRISIAGAQEKTALLFHNGTWCRPLGTTPTTHILKLPLGEVTRYRADFSTSVENEWLCAQIVRELGLDVADTQMTSFGAQRILVVERFDREWVTPAAGKGGKPYLVRIPQEDLCQAMGVPPRRKYEKDGGPGMGSCLDLMGASESPHDARLHFAQSQFAFWLLAATDGHAKNFSIFLGRNGTFAPTPLYDILSAWPVIGKGARMLPYQEAQLAMAIRSRNAHYALGEIHARHWKQLALISGGEVAWNAILALAANAGAALARVEAQLPPDFPGSVWDAISEGVRRHQKAFLSGVRAL